MRRRREMGGTCPQSGVGHRALTQRRSFLGGVAFCGCGLLAGRVEAESPRTLNHLSASARPCALNVFNSNEI